MSARKPRVTDADALAYHESTPAGKIEVRPTKPLSSQYDLALAYSPGVAAPCRAIAEDADAAYRYTAKGNLVAVVTNGTAVLGLGAIGAAASKPVMEGKAVLFKRFAGIDVFDIELDCTDPDELVETIARMAPGFGGINLEDIRAPECFVVESQLRNRVGIPVMHDDQHGTAIISGAALLNALELAGKRIEDVNTVMLGAGAAGVATARYYLTLGMKKENIVVIDKDGVVRSGERDPANPVSEFATDRTVRDLAAALEGADLLLGLSVGNLVTPDLLSRMAERPIIFALANPEPEIAYAAARASRPDAIIATGRSDHPNQVNNVLGFPYIFRGALDVGAKTINEEMKLAATAALRDLAREPVPEAVRRMYGEEEIAFGPDYLIPKPLDPRLLTVVAPAVAQAAMDSGVARSRIDDRQAYEAELLERVGIGQKLVGTIISQAKRRRRRVAIAEADDYIMLKAADQVREQGIAEPILLGPQERIETAIAEHGLRSLEGATVVDPAGQPETVERYARMLFARRQRKGVTLPEARRLVRERNYFGAVMLEAGDADALVSGRTREYPKIIRPALQVVGVAEGVGRVAGVYIVNCNRGTYFFADTTVNLEPDVDAMVDIIGLTAATVRSFNIEPVVAVLSHSNFGSTRSEEAERCRDAVAAARARFPELVIDGEVQANIALDPRLLEEVYPFSSLVGRRVNTLIFPNLSAGNTAYKLLGSLGAAELVGPILMGMAKPVHVLQLGATVREAVNVIAFAAAEAQRGE